MNIWQLITQASVLPVQEGTNLWDHLNSLTAGGETIFLVGESVAVVDAYNIESEVVDIISASVESISTEAVIVAVSTNAELEAITADMQLTEIETGADFQ